MHAFQNRAQQNLRAGIDARIVLQERDLKLLQALSTLRIIDRNQAALIGNFRSTTRVNARLHKLLQAGLLKRFFFVSALGGKKAVYSLSKKGGAMAGVLCKPLNRPADSFLIGDRFTAHQLSISDVYCAAIKRPLQVNSCVQHWRNFVKPLSKSASVIPDAYFEIHADDTMKPVFLEVDLGTEALKVWNAKIEGYLQLARSGEFEKEFGANRFSVLVVASSEQRMQSLRTHIRKTTPKLFYFSTLQKVVTEGFWKDIWLRPEGTQSQLLI